MPSARSYELKSQNYGVQTAHFVFTAGASGALPALSAYSEKWADLKSTTTKTAASTGLYDFFLNSVWLGIAGGWSIGVIQASYSASGACYGDITVDNVSTAAAPKFRVTFRTAAGAAVDLASGDKVFVSVPLKYRRI
jgi:hypothetical protein